MHTRVLKSLGLNLLAAYDPFLWVFMDPPWNDYQWHWVKMFPILPGLVPAELPRALLGLPRGSDTATYAAAAAATFILLAAATAVGSRGRDTASSRRYRWATAAVLLLVCCASSFVSYGLYRA